MGGDDLCAVCTYGIDIVRNDQCQNNVHLGKQCRVSAQQNAKFSLIRGNPSTPNVGWTPAPIAKSSETHPYSIKEQTNQAGHQTRSPINIRVRDSEQCHR